MHCDLINQELALGDRVAVAPKNYRGLILARVVGFTPKQVRLSYVNTWNYGDPGREETYLVFPGDVVKV